MGLHPRVLAAGLLAALACAPVALEAQTLVWDANTEPDIAGYRLYHGTESGRYTNQIDVGNRTSYSPPVDWSRPQYFAVQAYTVTGLTSPLSVEVQWIPAPPGEQTVITDFRANVDYPLLIGKPVTWTATASNPSKVVEYRFWLFRKTAWVMVRDYGPGNSFTWTPGWEDQGGPYHVQVWVRPVGATVEYEAWRGTEAFNVMTVPMEVTADVDFPTPTGNTVTWTAKLANAGATPLEYKFWVYTQRTGTWSVLRDYASSDQAVWMPSQTGRYAIQAWARRTGSTTAYNVWAGSNFVDVGPSPLTITSLTADRSFPTPTGTPISWTVRARGGTSGPLQYQFWLYSQNTGWVIRQPWSANKTFTWTPGWDEEGTHAVQVWARSNGSPAPYEAWSGAGFFSVTRAPLHLTTSTLFPVAPGTRVDWLASVQDPTTSLEYQFWLYSGESGTWSVARPYSPDNTYSWTPILTGTYALQAWARRPGSTAPYDAWRGTDFLQVSRSPARIHSLTANVALPAAPGTAITWTASASGGTSALEYQFWRFDAGTGWSMVQDYSPQNMYTWITSGSDVGQHALQVWVRSSGSGAKLETWAGSGYFQIQP